MANIINKTNKLALNEEDLTKYGIWDNYDSLREQLYKSENRKDCIIIQGAAFAVKGKAFLMSGVGGIDFLDSLAQLKGVDGIIGNNNAIFVSKNFDYVYSAQSKEELIKCYELEGAPQNIKINFLDGAPLAPLIFILRSFKTREEYESAKKKIGEIIFETADTFAGPPIKYAGSIKSRLRGKFLTKVRVVHCARRPSLEKKECLFDSYEKVREAINKFREYFCLVYTLFNQEMCDAIGMESTRNLSKSYNPVDPITPYLLKIAENFIGD